MNHEDRGPWYLLTGFALGVILALFYVRLVQPQRSTDRFPSDLSSEYQDRQRALIASAFMASSNLDRAKARLALLNDPDVYGVLARQAQEAFSDGSLPAEAQALGLLAVALGQDRNSDPDSSPSGEAGETPEPSPAVESGAQVLSLVSKELEPRIESPPQKTPLSATPSPTPAATRTPLPSPTITSTSIPASLFSLKEQEQVCDPLQPFPLIQVYARNQAGEPLAGIEMIVSWDGGEQHFFTGLKPEVSLGYADFQMASDRVYTLRPAGGGQPAQELGAVECKEGWGAWQLIFEQP
jgi:hypothetical protein